ncbi:diaminopimelate epimerase [Roseisalinus antarcticus]|uniref:Diaminopimelate epimerase n=1 Tax=Roseisalinus antarcticus TaxID=254357 RepID=A0A1Y5TX20_9RHOB|nr:diaminopimelate epimerase [Roseisalinus antarcticus]SLN75799.1 Diaminopimelate epimerase [Roseisalinus antarcticus]
MTRTPASGLPFMKMHGLGNDFVVLDGRTDPVRPDEALVAAMADRHRGVGFDQLAVIGPAEGADIALAFWNADGSPSAACGNATRCIADRVMAETGAEALRIETGRGVLHALRTETGLVSVNMGQPQTEWSAVPLAEAMDTLELPIDGRPTATGMGNPHCTFFVDDPEAVDLASFGPVHEHHPLFPERTNVQVARVTGPDRIRMRVWERGTGITLASGSSSCATAVAAVRRGLVSREVTMVLDGGELAIRWADDGVWMAGPTAHVFDGVWHG